MLIPRPKAGPALRALDAAVARAEREAAGIAPDPLDDALLAALAGLRDAMRTGEDKLDDLRRRMVRLGHETLG